MDELIKILTKIEPAMLVAIAAMLWIFKSHLDKKFEKIDQRFEKIEQKFDQKFEKIDQKFERINEVLKEIRTSLNRMEGAFYSKECCMLKE